MKCPLCRETQTDVYNTRSTRSGGQIWRRRKCLSCGESFTTYETPDLSFLRVSNKQGKPVAYSRATLFSDIYEAFEGVKATPATIDAVTDTVEAQILDTKLDIVPSLYITQIVLAALKHFSMPAFLRYMGAHGDLSSRTDLRKELKRYGK